ncbi:MAG TPA: hypothetical protein VKA28_01525, partial [Candidatus Bathyarchaeia archaeon]|nr:hypothetical protein [Candidatus Bathyarchaeia archaeon]
RNNLVNNTIQAQDDQPGQNSWDNEYPSGGNYWSDYKGVDNCSGPQQNICPSPDGIGDTPYVFNSAQDNYPLMNPFVPDPPAAVALGGGGGSAGSGGRAPLRA